MSRTFIAVLYVLSAGMLQVRSDIVTNLNPSADTALAEAFPANNFGATTDVFSGTTASGQRARSLFKFDVSELPANATITSVALTIQVVKKNIGGIGSNFDLFRLLQDWGEGTGTGNQGTLATPGEATWNNRLYPSTPWSTPGGQSGSDYASSSSATLFMDNVGAYTFNSSAGLVADVQAWVNNPASNFGWILISESEATSLTARRIASREDTLNAPVLVIHFTAPALPPAAPPTISGCTASGNSIVFSFNAQSNRTYRVQYADSPSATNWSTLTNISAQIADTLIPVSDSLTNPARFYRVRTP